METRGYQFVHVEGYGRKSDARGRSVDYVLAEAERCPGDCPHVAFPRTPETIFGVDLRGLRAEHDTRAEAARTVIAGGKTRRIRQDQLTLLTVIASHPAKVKEARSDPAVATEVAVWEERVVVWLREQWGDELASVIRHTDETHCHLHAYVLPSDKEMRARRLHPGAAAKAIAKVRASADGLDGKAANAFGDAAYRAAMREFQTGFWRQVGIPCGLARLGPARRRLTRAAWQSEQLAAAAAAETLRRAENVRATAEAARRDALRAALRAEAKRAAAASRHAAADAAALRAELAATAAREQAARAKAEAAAADIKRFSAEQQAQTLASSSQEMVEQARSEARRIIGAAEMEGTRLRRRAHTIGGWLGAIFHGLLGSAPSVVAAKAAASTRAEERNIAAALAGAARAETRQIRKQLVATQERLSAALAAVAVISIRRDQMQRALDRVRHPSPPGLASGPRPR